ncbi:MAG: hypothetical protein IJW79_03650, partial [Clostridia bacterium]|nr:hypothetical protein [Clostridia bacterium]
LLAENYVYTNEAGSMAIKNETKLAEARTLVVKSIDDVPAGKLIISIEKISTEGLIDTYRITYDDGTTYDFTVTNGAQGIQGIQGNPGADGHTPVITIQGGYWYVDGVNTNQAAQGVKGDTGNGIASIAKTGTEGLVDTYTITFTDGTSTTFTVTNGAQGIQGIQGNPGADGHTPVITIQGGYWYVDGVNTNQAAQGVKGDTGNGIASIAKTGTEGLVDTYTITFTDGTTTTFTVTNGAQGEQGVQGDKGDSGENGKTPTFKIENGELKVSYDNGATWTSLGNVQGADGADGEDGRNGSSGNNGKDGKDGKDGITPQLRINLETNEWEVSYDNGTTWISLGVKATGEKGDKGDKGDTGAAGADGKDGIDGKDGAVIDKGADGLVIVAIIIGCIAISGEIAFLVYAIIKKRKGEK